MNDRLKFGDSFCAYHFIHKHLNTKKERKMCCYSTQVISDDDLPKIREQSLKGEKIDGCEGCYMMEDKKQISPRQTNTMEWIKKYPDLLKQATEKDTDPIWYDLRVSNLCNLQCIMCNTESSSRIAKAENKDDPFLQWVPTEDINPKAKRIYMAGGEPFLIKEFADMLENINDECQIIINTNMTILTIHMMKILKRFKDVNITVSLDGFKEVNDSIRVGSSWDTIVKNMEILLDSLEKPYNELFHIHSVLQKDNINNLYLLGDWITSKNIDNWTLTELKTPSHLRCEHIDIDIVAVNRLKNNQLVKNNISNMKIIEGILDER